MHTGTETHSRDEYELLLLKVEEQDQMNLCLERKLARLTRLEMAVRSFAQVDAAARELLTVLEDCHGIA